MPREFKRADRVADAVQRSLAQIIQQEVRDPRLGMVNVNSVSVSKDLAIAKVYVTFVGIDSSEDAEASVKILNNASSYVRNLMAKDLNIRTTPKLLFYFDKSTVQSQQLSNLIDKAVAKDKAQHQQDDDGTE